MPHFVGVFSVFLLRQFFMSLPVELIEAARLDGAGPFRTFFSIRLPLARPGLLAATMAWVSIIVLFLVLWRQFIQGIAFTGST